MYLSMYGQKETGTNKNVEGERERTHTLDLALDLTGHPKGIPGCSHSPQSAITHISMYMYKYKEKESEQGKKRKRQIHRCKGFPEYIAAIDCAMISY